MLRSVGVVLLLAGMAGADARAADSQAGFLVSATVPERVSIEAIDQPSRLVISADDVLRGYKDVSARYLVSHNTERGWLLRLSPRVGLTRQVEVRGLGGRVVLEDEGIEVFRAGESGRERLSLEYRLVLDPAALPGTYELPFQVSATTL